MNNNTNNILALFFCLLSSSMLWAGNPDRSGQAGATELLINPWARSSGFHGMNTATVRGIESSRNNIGGLAFVEKTEVVFSHNLWLKGSGVNVSSLGLAQKIGESSVIGLNAMSVGFGDIPVTTENDPEGLSGATFSPSLLNIGVSYARSFSESIHVGFQLTLISETISDASATGATFDMGIQYVTGKDNNIHFGVALRNVGTPLKFSGDGMTYQLEAPQGNYNITIDQRTEKFEMPSQLNIGLGYDFKFGTMHRLTALGNFTSNSFTKDFLGAGLEYAFREMFMVRAGYRHEQGIRGSLDFNERSSAFTGLSAGVTLEVPFKEGGPSIGIDYAYRTTNPYDGTHTFGLRIAL